MTIQVSGLGAMRGGRIILHPTSLSMDYGERVGLVGASGSGKSTLGHLMIDDLRARGLAVAHVPQSPDEALDPLRSMGFHWHEAERALGLQPDADRQNRLFCALDIAHGDLRKRPWGWSRGMQQRFVVAMALLERPAVLVLDEPTSALDPVVAARAMDLLDEVLEGSPTATVLITHDLGLAAARVSRLLVMADGRIVEDRPTAILLNAPETAAARALAAHRNWLELPC